MANKGIKGITIRLDGDVTGLDKALKDVNQQSRNLQTELRAVQNGLKFNPNDTVLLAQKQQLLGEEIENTSEKLRRLKAAEQEVQEQFRKGDISAEQFRAFQREVQSTEGKLNGLKNQLISTKQEQENVENSTRQLTTLFEALGTDVDGLSDALGSGLTNAIRNGTANSRQLEDAIDKIGRAALGTDVDLEKMRKALRSIDDGASIEEVRRDLDQLKPSADKAQGSIKELGSELAGLVGGLAAGGGIAGIIKSALDTSSLNTKVDIGFNVPPESLKVVKDAIKTVEAYGVDGEAALEGVRRQWALNKEATDETNKAVVKGAATIAAAYSGIDFNELIQETNEISASLEISNEEALALTNALLKIGFPPEQLDIISEYGLQLKMAGYDAKEIQAIMAAGVETGTWNIDNLLDGLKEGRIKLVEFGQEVPKATEELISQTDISAKQLQEWGKAVAAGGEAGTAAMKEVAKALTSVENETLRNALGVQIFGTMWEDQGSYITQTLLTMDQHLSSAKDNQEQLNAATEKLDVDPAIQMQQALSDIKTAISPLLDDIASVVGKTAEWASENNKLAGSITGVATAAGIMTGGMMAAGPVLASMKSAAGALGTSLGALSGTLGVIAAGVAGLFAQFTYLDKNWEKLGEKSRGLQALFTAAYGPIGFLVAGLKTFENVTSSALGEFGRFGDSVSEETQQAVASLLELSNQATVALNQMSWSGQTVTDEMVTNITELFAQMGDQILANMQTDQAEQLAAMQTFFDSSAALTEAEEAEILAGMQEHQSAQQTAVQEGQARIAEILTNAKNDKRAITEAEADEIAAIQEQMKNTAVQVMSQSQAEQQAILEVLKAEAGRLTAEQAAEVVKNSKQQKDEVVKEANEQYTKTVAEIIKQRDEAGTITADQANKLIQEAKRQRDETIKNAEDMHRNVVSEAKAQAQEHVNQVDWESGEVKSKWQMMKDEVIRKAGEMKTGLATKLDEMKTNFSTKWEEIKQLPGKKLQEAKNDASTKMQEIRTSIKNILDEIKGFFENLKLKIPKPELPALPHFSISGDFSLNPPSVPKISVDWYDKGGVFYGPKIIGVGEKRPEFVGALDDLKAVVKSAIQEVSSASSMQSFSSSTTSNVYHISMNVTSEDLDNFKKVIRVMERLPQAIRSR